MIPCEGCGAQQESDAQFCAQSGRALPQIAFTEGEKAEALRVELARLRAELESVEDAIEIQSLDSMNHDTASTPPRNM